jgi:hypothetical protein
VGSRTRFMQMSSRAQRIRRRNTTDCVYHTAREVAMNFIKTWSTLNIVYRMTTAEVLIFLIYEIHPDDGSGILHRNVGNNSQVIFYHNTDDRSKTSNNFCSVVLLTYLQQLRNYSEVETVSSM